MAKASVSKCIHQPYTHWPSFNTKEFGLVAPCRAQCLEHPDWPVDAPYQTGYPPPYYSWHYHSDILGLVQSCYGKLKLKPAGKKWNGGPRLMPKVPRRKGPLGLSVVPNLNVVDHIKHAVSPPKEPDDSLSCWDCGHIYDDEQEAEEHFRQRQHSSVKHGRRRYG